MVFEKDFLPPTCHSSKTLLDVGGIILHHISAVYVDETRPYDRELIKDIFVDNSVSAHILIERDGNPVQLMPLHLQAWHAGESILNGREGCNKFTIGIELAATPDDDFTLAQYLTTRLICRDYMQDFGWGWEQVSSHRIVRREYRMQHGEASAKPKYDPNSNFDWNLLRG